MAKSVARDRMAGILDDDVIIAPAPADHAPSVPDKPSSPRQKSRSEEPAEAVPQVSDPLVLERLDEAERETEDLRRELEELDATWQKRLADSPPAGEPHENPIANVISLANRIRDLKKGLDTPPK
jgi:hypothetical protein